MSSLKSRFHLFLLAISAASPAAHALPAPQVFVPDRHTVMLLQATAAGDSWEDVMGNFHPQVEGATMKTDPDLGPVLKWGEQAGLTVKDNGKLDFSRSFTLEMLVKLPPGASGTAALKIGSFSTSIRDNTFHIDWMSPPTVPVATDTDQQYRYFPVGGTGFPGRVKIPVNEWARLSFSYDPTLRVARVWINDTPDQKFYLPDREIPGKPMGALPLENNHQTTLSMLRVPGAQVASIRLSNVARALTPLPPLESYAHALPYREQSMVILDHVDPRQLPMHVGIRSGKILLQEIALGDATRRVIFYDRPQSTGIYPLTITISREGKVLSTHTVEMSAGDHRKDPVHFDEHNRFIVDGKPSFPLIIYHAFEEDLPELARLGFDALSGPRYPGHALMTLLTRTPALIWKTREYLEAAKAAGIRLLGNNGIFAAGGSTEINLLAFRELGTDPGLLLWYGADEPGRERIRQLRQGYAKARPLQSRPVLVLTNRNDHLPRVAEACDIVGVDPYPIPNISLRSVALATRLAREASADQKPVFTALPQYGDKRPSFTELRCMAYLAIVSGAKALAIYAWDERNAITMQGWRTKDHAEDLQILTDFMAEMRQIKDTILTLPNSSENLQPHPFHPALHSVLKEDGSRRYLLVVNDSRSAEQGTLSIPRMESGVGRDLFHPDKAISVRGGTVKLTLAPLEVNLYELFGPEE